MGKVVLTQDDILKLDKLINMFDKQKKKFEKLKKDYQDGIIDFESSTDIIFYDAYIVLAKLIKKLPNVEGSDVFQAFVNVVLNDLIGDFSKLEDWCTKMLDTTTSIHNDVTANYNDMLDLDLLVEELSQMHNIPIEKFSVIVVNDAPKIMRLLLVMWAVINDQGLSDYVLFVYKFMFRIISLWPQLSNGTSKITLDQVKDIYSDFKYKERLNKMHKEILNLVPVDTVDNEFDSLNMKILGPIIEEFGVMLQEKINNGTYNDTDKAIASSIVLICNQIHKCLDSYIKVKDSSSYEYFFDIRGENFDISLISKLRRFNMFVDITEKINLPNNLVSILDLIYYLSLLIDWKTQYTNKYPGSLDVFSVCSAFNMWLYDGRKLDRNSYVPLANDIAREVQHLSIDEKIDYYLEHIAKYREEMIKENGGSLVNVLKARMEQLGNTGVDNGDVLEQEPKGRTGRY